MRRAIECLSCQPEHVLIDARRLRDLHIPQQPIVKGDSKSLTIAAASILAKTVRDALMLGHDLTLTSCNSQSSATNARLFGQA
jgi:ribonuclease HII